MTKEQYNRAVAISNRLDALADTKKNIESTSAHLCISPINAATAITDVARTGRCAP